MEEVYTKDSHYKSEKVVMETFNINKSFPGVKALSDINVKIHEGEVVAILGENGAGKSTLIKILSGVYQPDSGRMG